MRWPPSMTASKTLPLVAALLLTGCVSDDDPTSPAPSEPDPHVELSPTEHLLRASMALRGIRPAPGELEQVAADPSTLEGIVDGYLDSSEFGQVIRDMHNEALLSRVDWAFYPAGFPSVGTLEGVDPFVVNGSVQEAALRLIEQVVLSGAPYAEIVTADYVYVSDIVATVWGNLDYPAGGSGWQKAHFTDGRPHAGILSDPWVFTRHQSTISNNNRGRANAISKALLCYDFLSRDIEIDASIDLSDPEVVANAVVDNPTCASCHQTLDPMASFFGDYFPIIVPGSLEGYPYDDYNSLAEGDMSQPFYFPGIFELAGSEPRERAYFGEPGEDVADLGRMIAEDPRFSLCAAKRFYAYFNQRRIDEVALSAVADLQLDFVKKGFDAKALAKAVVLGRDFRRSHATTPTAAEDLVGVRVVQPNQLSSLIADLTGFRWMSQRLVTEDVDLPSVDLVRDSFLGFQILGGGTDPRRRGGGPRRRERLRRARPRRAAALPRDAGARWRRGRNS